MITPDDGMEISKVTVNGKEFTVTDNKLTGLKTGDKVEVTFAKIPPTKEETDKAFKEKALKLELTVRTSKTENTYINTTGKKDAKYYYKAKLMIYDNEGNLTAQTELKQCRYGKESGQGRSYRDSRRRSAVLIITASFLPGNILPLQTHQVMMPLAVL